MIDKFFKSLMVVFSICIVATGIFAGYSTIELHPVGPKEHRHQKHVEFSEQVIELLKSDEEIHKDALVEIFETDMELEKSEYKLYQSLYKIN